MAIRTATLADVGTVEALWDASIPVWQSLFPGDYETWTGKGYVAFWLQFKPVCVIYLYENPAPQAFFMVNKGATEYGANLSTLQTGSPAQRNTRIRNAIRESGARWGVDAQARGASFCVYKGATVGVAKQSLDRLGQFGTQEVVDNTIVYTVTPQQMIAGAATV